jgi:hypothetical protein
MHKMDVERNDLLVKELIAFKWCDQCKNAPPLLGPSDQINLEKLPRCNMNCGPRIFGRLIPHMKEYGQVGKKILDIKCEIEAIDQQTIKFKDFQKAKKEMEFEKIKQVANYKP